MARKKSRSRKPVLDDVDRAILVTLQENAKITNTALSEQVGISPPSTLERVKKLERRGVIQGYTALLDADALNQPILAIVHVSMQEHSATVLENAKEKLSAFEEVQSCWYCAGDEDFILKVRARDMNDYERLITRKLAGVRGIGRMRTSFVLNSIKDSTKLNVDEVE